MTQKEEIKAVLVTVFADQYLNPMFSDAEGKHTLYPPTQPTMAWTKDGEEMIPIIALPFHDFTIIDCDDASVSLDKTNVIAWVKTERGWQAIFAGVPKTVHMQHQDPLYLQLSKQKEAWCMRVRSRDGGTPRMLRVLDIRACSPLPRRGWTMVRR